MLHADTCRWTFVKYLLKSDSRPLLTLFLGTTSQAIICFRPLHCFSSPTRLLWGHLLPKHPTSLFTSAEPVHKLNLKSTHVLFTAHTFSVVLSFGGQYGLHVFDVQHAEQDSGVLECNHSARRMLLHEVHSDAMQEVL